MFHQQHVVIIGGGFSGTALAVQLLHEHAAPLTVTVVEARTSLGHGLAYGTSDDGHWLNTRNGTLSAIEEDPEHFLRWLEISGQNPSAHGFARRAEYGRYLQHTLDDAAARAVGWGSQLHTRLGRRVSDVDPTGDGFRVRLDDGEVIDCTKVVLASGYTLPADPLNGALGPDCPRYLRNPWDHARLAAIQRHESVLLIGTGLTMVDAALSLSRRGHLGALHAVSRRGLLPRGHATLTDALPFDLCEAHQHRIAPELAATLAGMIADGRLQLRAGRIVGAIDCGNMVVVEEHPRGQPAISRNPYRWIINCTGASLGGHARQSLEGRLLEKGLLAADPHGLGFLCDDAGAVQGARVRAAGLYLIGPACRPHSFEHTAIPELRRQAAALARVIAARSRHDRPRSWIPGGLNIEPLAVSRWRQAPTQSNASLYHGENQP